MRDRAAGAGPAGGPLLRLDFATFVRAVDALGGIIGRARAHLDRALPSPDYGVTTIRFDPGRQAIDGERALIYVRTRHSDGDFGRSMRQLQVVRALAAEVTQPESWPRLVDSTGYFREAFCPT